MNVKTALRNATRRIQKRAIATAALDAELLLAAALGRDRQYVLSHFDKELTERQKAILAEMVLRRCNFEPIAYITGTKDFYGRSFFVNRAVLIPRPETELLVETIIKHGRNKPITIADIGTGSGCIAISLALALPKATVIATDISPEAIAVAKKNARRHKAAVTFTTGNLLEPLEETAFDVLVANLPYMPSEQITKLQPATVDPTLELAEQIPIRFEPIIALSGGSDGLLLYRRLFEQLARRTELPAMVAIEHGENHRAALIELLESHYPTQAVTLRRDYAKLPRFIIAQR
ncbi:MAG: protein-(glutamine-N5) methyltransferase, release factor-specific [Candidatus Buchananbacteria bacterium RIFCSPHIGHO2_01_FULL_47_11b]|uniref:Release factor glutamine methyltransferase n=1 Tax=Candidatus Buchananbacteria bacterium RIFCSPHIGHO2_01_FULL_47_11b TaxID=1797537 RepID=A0A1G1Y790_9BACT|nr:MAG: protein-(glutamine-N5) methyltransferase, release factor-specific [Candidatus Buchananbacteria bacterium RIFCSPHIGHO2_01_FULL_47_11b]